METKHTPGPWEFGPGYVTGDTVFDLIGPGGRKVISSASYENMWLASYDDETDAANARLIAAAPDLLEALKACEAWIVDLANSGDAGFWDASKAPEVIQARAAIRRAQGEGSE